MLIMIQLITHFLAMLFLDIYDDIRSTCKVIADRTDHLQLSLDLKDQLAQVAKTHER